MICSHPGISSYPFEQSVCLITDVNEKEIRGLIINKPVIDQGLYNRSRYNDIEEQLWRLYQRYQTVRHSIDSLGNSNNISNIPGVVTSSPMLTGGPVRPSLTILHRLEAFSDVSELIIDGEFPVYKVDASKFEEFGDRLHEQIRIIEENGLNSLENFPSTSSTPRIDQIPTADMLVVLGHSVWTPAQFRNELSKGDWLPIQGNGIHVFSHSSQAATTSKSPIKSATVKSNEKLVTENSVIEIPESSELSNTSELVTRAVSMLTSAHLPAISFPSKHLWSHAWHTMGGEFRHFAAIEAVDENEANIQRLKRRQAKSKNPHPKWSKKETDNTGNIP